MASFFRTKVVSDIGTTPIDILETATLNKFTVIGCNLANTIDENVVVDIQIEGPDTTVAYWIRQLLIQPYTSAKIITNGEKLILMENCKMTIVSDTANSIDAVISYAELI